MADPYEVFDYNMPIEARQQDVGLFQVDSQYIVNSSILGGKGFSLIDVESIDGDDVDLLVHNFSQISAAIPEPSTWAIMLIDLGGLGAMMRRRRSDAPENCLAADTVPKSRWCRRQASS